MKTIRKTIDLDQLPEMSKKALSRLDAIKDKDINYSDIPELNAAFWDNSNIITPEHKKEAISLRVDTDVLKWFKEQGKGYTTRMNAVLRHFYEVQQKSPPDHRSVK